MADEEDTSQVRWGFKGFSPLRKPTSSDATVQVTKESNICRLESALKVRTMLTAVVIASAVIPMAMVMSDYAVRASDPMTSWHVPFIGAMFLFGMAGWALPGSFNQISLHMPNLNFPTCGTEPMNWPSSFHEAVIRDSPRRTMFMNVSVGELLSNHMHVSGAILEDYILGLLDEKTRRAVDKHLRMCDKCFDEIQAAERTMQGGGSDDLQPVITKPEVKETAANSGAVASLEWKGGTTLWLNDASYTLVPVEDYSVLARVELLTLWQLLDKIAEDEKSPGACLATIEGDQMLKMFPLSKFKEMQLAVAAGRSIVADSRSAKSLSGHSCVNRRVLQYAESTFTVDVLTDDGDNVYLSVHFKEVA